MFLTQNLRDIALDWSRPDWFRPDRSLVDFAPGAAAFLALLVFAEVLLTAASKPATYFSLETKDRARDHPCICDMQVGGLGMHL